MMKQRIFCSYYVTEYSDHIMDTGMVFVIPSSYIKLILNTTLL